jgi:uncharacterized RDD family membrane protein YckC
MSNDQPLVRYAGFWRRLLAFMIDEAALTIGLFIIVMVFLMVMYVFVLLQRIDYKTIWGISAILPYVLYLPVLWLYRTLMESSKVQGTLGKMALGIVVTDLSLARISFGRANGRFWSRAFSSFLLGIGFILIAFTKRKQAVHDLVAGTLVLRKR